MRTPTLVMVMALNTISLVLLSIGPGTNRSIVLTTGNNFSSISSLVTKNVMQWSVMLASRTMLPPRVKAITGTSPNIVVTVEPRLLVSRLDPTW